jgi:hypothetical protein
MNHQPSKLSRQILFSVVVAALLAGCQSEQPPRAQNSVPPPPVAPLAAPVAISPAASSVVNAPPAVQTVVRIRAGSTTNWTDSQGNMWGPDQGFSGGDTDERPDVAITNTTDPDIYRAEHYGMDSFSTPLANGKYLVKLHFAETFEGIEGPGQRVFSFNVQGQEFKDFDVFARAGGPFKAYIVSVPVEVTNHKLTITFTTQIENPQINGIEIIPQM